MMKHPRRVLLSLMFGWLSMAGGQVPTAEPFESTPPSFFNNTNSTNSTNSTLAPIGPSLAPVTIAPMQEPDTPTDLPSLPLPTDVPVIPTDAPITPTEAPVQPTDAPVAATPQPTQPLPTATPTEAPVPTDAPITPTLTPTEPPTDSPTALPTRRPVDPTGRKVFTATGVSITFGNVGSLSNNALSEWKTVTEEWFASAYNDRRRLRELQSNPASLGVTGMETDITVRGSSPGSNGNTITYDQTISYFESVGNQAPESLIQIPYAYGPTNARYSDLLTGITGFENVNTPIAIPNLPTQAPTASPTAQPTSSTDNKNTVGNTNLTLGALIGICVGSFVGAVILGYLGYAWCCKPVDGVGAGYVSAGASQPPSHFAMSQGEDISTIDDPVQKIGALDSVAEYGDQSVATVDYDYSKAYGGGGDTSVVSSVGGTLGDNTRQTAGYVAGSAARANLGASFETEGFRDDDNNVKEEIIDIMAPAGKLGVVIDTPDDGAPVVHAVKDSSVIADQIRVGDKLIAVDDEDVRTMSAIKVSKLISKKSANPTRKLSIVRTTYVD